MVQHRLELTWYNKDKALIPTETGKYGYTWVDPADPRYCETHTLVMGEYVQGKQAEKTDEYQYSSRAGLTPQTDNLMILGESGDVLEALVRVPELAEKYVGKVKLIYIDPPFNTAQTFESYEDNLEHSIWLTMMRDRLYHLKKLLSDDGSIWVHLDDVENHRMRMLLDEIFGAGNFVAEMQWEKTYSPRNDSKGIPVVTDVILVYGKTNTPQINRLDRSAGMDSRYSNPDNDTRGVWTMGDLAAPGAATHQGMVYGIQQPITGEIIYPAKGRHWSYGQETMVDIMNQWANYELVDLGDTEQRAEICGILPEKVREDVLGLVLKDPSEMEKAANRYKAWNWPEIVITNKGQGRFRRKKWLSEVAGAAPRNLLKWSEVNHSDGAKKEIQALFPDQNSFSTPKPERLLERIIHIGSNPGDVVLDVFGGSGTTAAVAQKMGRRWVTCELLESTFNTFTRPRLEKVVNNQDPGGITRTKGERVALDELPEGLDPEAAAQFNSALTKILKQHPELKSESSIKKLKQVTKTKNMKEVVNWRGGGGFQVAHLSPACFDYDPILDRVLLTEDATGQVLIDSIAANLGFALPHADEDTVFDGRRGNSLLKVHEGIATTDLVDQLVAQIQPGERIVLASTIIQDGVREYLRKACKGSRVVAVPDDIFRYTESGDH